MTKNEAKTLKNGSKIYFMDCNYTFKEENVLKIDIDDANDIVKVQLDNGCIDIFDDKDHKYLFYTKEEALKALKSRVKEINALIRSIKKGIENKK